ncbi:Protein POOR HOMOLOGOUS SYNAPSIS 1 [Cardamine amara subsp. amara]|uniref:Protein POOR HOMOLOGOUS SYNAPSIS 1 n=1 Tax=Cardamine amara subsp. amara TaxID=228776 RepID=A0ABD1C048_CARAN
MAGSRTASIREHHRGNSEGASKCSRWLICFARFVQYPSSPSPCLGLKPLGKRELCHSPHGTWLSTSSSTVSLHMVDKVIRSGVILSVELDGKVLEEHYISKLNFSWPQMSCVSGFPTRGSRVILVSYKDFENEIQKFALRFSTCDAASSFVVALKEKLKGLEKAGNQKIETSSEVSFQSVYNSSIEIVPRSTEEQPNMVNPLCRATEEQPYMVNPLCRAIEEQPYMVNPLCRVTEEQPYMVNSLCRATEEQPNMVDSYTPQMLPRLEYETGQTVYQPQSMLSQIPNENFINHPPSFTTLLSGCFPNSTLGQTTVKQDPDLKSQILKYMEDSAFQDMLHKVETIMDEVGGSWIL